MIIQDCKIAPVKPAAKPEPVIPVVEAEIVNKPEPVKKAAPKPGRPKKK